MHILITGATWFLGRHLAYYLLEQWHTIAISARDTTKAYRLFGDSTTVFPRNFPHQSFPTAVLENADACIHLMGAPITLQRQNKSQKFALRSSRVESTRQLVQAIWTQQLHLICWSAIGIYPHAPWARLAEHIPIVPHSFLQTLVRDRELAAARYQHGPVTHFRTSLVLWDGWVLHTLRSKAIKNLLPTIGDSTVTANWIHVTDRCRAVEHILTHQIYWPVNMCAPQPTSYNKLYKHIASQRDKKHIHLDSRALPKLFFGQSAQLLLTDHQVVPSVLMDTDFQRNSSSIDKVTL